VYPDLREVHDHEVPDIIGRILKSEEILEAVGMEAI